MLLPITSVLKHYHGLSLRHSSNTSN